MVFWRHCFWHNVSERNRPEPDAIVAGPREMPDFLINRLVTHGADKMFDLVADVERYPEFLPFCQRQVVRSRETRGDIVTLTTDMTVAHLVFRETFRSRVTLDRANGRILIAAADGLVRRLHGRWD